MLTSLNSSVAALNGPWKNESQVVAVNTSKMSFLHVALSTSTSL